MGIHRVALVLLASALLIKAHPSLAAEDVLLNDADLVRLPGGVGSAMIDIPPQNIELPIISDDARGDAATPLRQLDDEGRAHGFADILYDNRDRGHSSLDPALFPALSDSPMASSSWPRMLTMA